MRLYHGSDLDSVRRLDAGEALDPTTAGLLKIDGPAGFFLATDLPDAEFFALRQGRGPGAVLALELSDTAVEELLQSGAIQRPIPRGPRSPRFYGDELFVPPGAFNLFNELRGRGEIQVTEV